MKDHGVCIDRESLTIIVCHGNTRRNAVCVTSKEQRRLRLQEMNSSQELRLLVEYLSTMTATEKANVSVAASALLELPLCALAKETLSDMMNLCQSTKPMRMHELLVFNDKRRKLDRKMYSILKRQKRIASKVAAKLLDLEPQNACPGRQAANTKSLGQNDACHTG